MWENHSHKLEKGESQKMKPHPHTPRYYVSLAGGHLLVLSGLFLAQELTLGFLPFWRFIHMGILPLSPFVFLATSIWLSRRYFRVEGHE